MASYVVTVDNDILYIPGIVSENFEFETEEPTKSVEGTRNYLSSYSTKIKVKWTTSANINSNEQFWRLYGYLKARMWQEETVFIDRLNAFVVGYLRIKTVTSQFAGAYKNRKSLEIEFIQK